MVGKQSHLQIQIVMQLQGKLQGCKHDATMHFPVYLLTMQYYKIYATSDVEHDTNAWYFRLWCTLSEISELQWNLQRIGARPHYQKKFEICYSSVQEDEGKELTSYFGIILMIIVHFENI